MIDCVWSEVLWTNLLLTNTTKVNSANNNKWSTLIEGISNIDELNNFKNEISDQVCEEFRARSGVSVYEWTGRGFVSIYSPQLCSRFVVTSLPSVCCYSVQLSTLLSLTSPCTSVYSAVTSKYHTVILTLIRCIHLLCAWTLDYLRPDRIAPLASDLSRDCVRYWHCCCTIQLFTWIIISLLF